MYKVTKRLEVAGAHALALDYESKCENVHGHNWIVDVTCVSEELDDNGMVIDFSKIKEVVMQLDHQYLNNMIPNINPTAENIARWICENVPKCVHVKVRESKGNTASYWLKTWEG